MRRVDRLRQTVPAAGQWLPILVLGSLLALVTWPISSLRPIGGIDGSWQAGLVMGLELGLRWGVDVVWTYGPLGFLATPQVFDPGLGIVSWLFVVLAHVGLDVVIVWLAWRSESRFGAIALAVVGALLAAHVRSTVAVTLLALVVGIELLRRDRSHQSRVARPRALAIAAGLGALGGLIFLVKINDGIGILVIAFLTAAGLTIWRVALAASAAGAAGAVLVLWLAARQQLPDLVSYVTTGRELVTGYSTAMAIDDPGLDWQYIAIAVAVALLGWSFLRTVRGWRRQGAAAAAVAIGVFCFLMYKEAFVRHFGAGFFEATALVAVWFLPWPRSDRAARLLVLTAMVLAVLGTSGTRSLANVGPGRIRTALVQAVTIGSAEGRASTIDVARASLRARYAIPASMLATMGSGTVHAEPFETAVLWAYPELSWRPLPVMQPYSAYTEALDQLNAEAVASNNGPGFILRSRRRSLDARYPFYETPRAALEEVCRFVEVAVNDKWQLLARGPTRCGKPQPLGTVTVRPGDAVTVPPAPSADRLVVAHVDGIESGPLAALRAFVHRSPTWLIRLRGTYRLVPQTASGPLILRTPKSLGWTAAFAPPPAVSTFTIATGSYRTITGAQPDVTLTIRFESIELRPMP